VTGSRTPAEVLREARRKDSLDKRTKVLAVVDQMVAQSEPVTFAAVAKAAGVSTWLVYAEGVREHIEAARKGQSASGRRSRQAGASASAASLATDLELAREELKALRQERDRLKEALRRNLGQQVEGRTSQDLISRVQELENANALLAGQLKEALGLKESLERELEEAQDDLIGARTALRSMMIDQNRSSGAAEGSEDPA